MKKLYEQFHKLGVVPVVVLDEAKDAHSDITRRLFLKLLT